MCVSITSPTAWVLPVTVNVSGVGTFQTTTDQYGRFMVAVPAPRIVDGGRLQMASQNALRFHGRIAYDDSYHGLALDADEGRRIAAQLENRTVMFMASHGVTVIGPTVAWAFDDLYYLERACMHQVLATQAAAGAPTSARSEASRRPLLRQCTEMEIGPLTEGQSVRRLMPANLYPPILWP